MREDNSTQEQPTTAVNEQPQTTLGRWPLRWTAVAISVITVLAVVYTLYFAQSLIIPLVAAVFLNLLFSPLVRRLHRRGIPRVVTAVGVVVLLIVLATSALYYMSGPAISFAQRLPEELKRKEYQLRGLVEPIERIRDAAEEVEQAAETARESAMNETDESDENAAPGADPINQSTTNNKPDSPDEKEATEEVDAAAQTVRIRGPGLVETGLQYARSLGFAGGIALVLAMFLLSAGDMFLQKLVNILPTPTGKWEAVKVMRSIEQEISTYLSTITIINVSLGVVTGLVMWLLGLPYPILWGTMVAVLNFVPYLGALVSMVILAIVGIVTFDPVVRAIWPPLVFFALTALEANIITPLLIGRRLQINNVVVFVAITFWGWLWGIAGALLAVPMLVAIKILADNLEPLHPLAEFLSAPESALTNNRTPAEGDRKETAQAGGKPAPAS